MNARLVPFPDNVIGFISLRTKSNYTFSLASQSGGAYTFAYGIAIPALP